MHTPKKEFEGRILFFFFKPLPLNSLLDNDSNPTASYQVPLPNAISLGD